MNAKLSLTTRTALAVLLAMMLAMLSAGTALADIKARVRVRNNRNGCPIPDAKVEIPTSIGKKTAVTDSNGEAIVDPVRPGPFKHTIIVSAPGYHTRTITQDMDAWTTVDVDVYLDPTSPPPPPKTNTGSDKTAGNARNSGKAGDPVTTSIGEYYFTMSLLDLDGALPLGFALYYASSIDKKLGAYNVRFTAIALRTTITSPRRRRATIPTRSSSAVANSFRSRKARTENLP